MRFRSWRDWAALAAIVGIMSSVNTSLAVDRMLGLVPSDGAAMFMKRFTPSAGTAILGVQFANNDPSTVFPEVSLIRGPLTTVSQGTVVASATNVQAVVGGTVNVLWSAPVQVTGNDPYYVVIRIPAGPGKTGPGTGPGIGATMVAAPNGSFVASDTGTPPMPIAADLALSLVTRSGTLGGGGPFKTGLTPSENPAASRTFLMVRRQGSGKVSATIDFGLEHPMEINLTIYDIAGRRIRSLLHATMHEGAYHQEWDGHNEQEQAVASGVYFVRLQADARALVQKLVMVR